MSKFDFVHCEGRPPIGVLPIGRRGAFARDPARSGAPKLVLR